MLERKGGSGWRCAHGAKCLAACPGCPYAHGEPRPETRACHLCHGLGYFEINGGNDTKECHRCGGTGRAK